MHQITNCKTVCKHEIQEATQMPRHRTVVKLSIEHAEENIYYEIIGKNKDLHEQIWNNIQDTLLSDTQDRLINQNTKHSGMLPSCK